MFHVHRRVLKDIRLGHINNLPSELLEEIFVLYAGCFPPLLGSDAPEDSGWAVLLIVCRLWYSLIMHCTEFWAIACCDNPSTMSRSITLCGGRGVRYVLSDDGPRGDWPRCELEVRDAVSARALKEFDPPLCAQIRVNARGDVAGHLTKLFEASDREPLPLLTELFIGWGSDDSPDFYACVFFGVICLCYGRR